MFLEPKFYTDKPRGWIEVICGPMFSGKTEELIRRIKRANIASQKTIIFKPDIDVRYSETEVVSHDSNVLPSVLLKKPEEILAKVDAAQVVGIDEAQFFGKTLVRVCEILALESRRVIIAGLDMDYLGRPFGPVPELMAVAEYVTKVHAICVKCGTLATHSFRTSSNQENVLVGAKDHYEPRCRFCFNSGMET
jgi:thymidine kinase